MASQFDPFTQNVTFHSADGAPFEVPVAELNTFVFYNTKVCINYGAQLGASLILAIVLALVTAPDKRRSIVFILNTSALLLNFARMLCMALYFTLEWSEVYTYFAFDYSRIPTSAYANSVIATVFSTLLIVCVEISLLVQTQAVCSTLRELHRRILLAVSIMIALVPIGFRLGLMVMNAKYIVLSKDFTPFIWLQSATNIAITISICFFSCIFIAKLGYAIHTRRSLGLRGFGAMQVIFIMSCQTMTVPAIFSILQYFWPKLELNSNMLTLLVLSLPLSSMWCAAATRHSFESNSARHLWAGPSKTFASRSKLSNGSFSQPSTGTSATLMSEKAAAHPVDRLYPEIADPSHITVNRNFSLSSEVV